MYTKSIPSKKGMLIMTISRVPPSIGQEVGLGCAGRRL